MNLRKRIVVSAAMIMIVPSAANALWYGSKSAHETLDDCLKHYNKCYWGGALIESTGQKVPLIAQPKPPFVGPDVKSMTRPPPVGRPLPTDGDILSYSTKRPTPQETAASKLIHLCFTGSVVMKPPCTKDQVDIWVKA